MEVIATITPVACTPTLSGNGVADYGAMPASILTPRSITPLSPKSLTLTISCDAGVKLRLRIIDNRRDSIVAGIVAAGSGNSMLNDHFNFGLGIAAGKNIGGYAITLDPHSYTGDYQQAQLLSSADGGVTWQQASNGAGCQRPHVFLGRASQRRPLGVQEYCRNGERASLPQPAGGVVVVAGNSARWCGDAGVVLPLTAGNHLRRNDDVSVRSTQNCPLPRQSVWSATRLPAAETKASISTFMEKLLPLTGLSSLTGTAPSFGNNAIAALMISGCCPATFTLPRFTALPSVARPTIAA